MSQTLLIALLRGINVGGRNKIPMAELRTICEELGWQHVQSYIQSGNIVFQADSMPLELETSLEQAIEQHFALNIPVIVRSASTWQSSMADNPFPIESQESPNLVMLALAKSPLKSEAALTLQERAAHGEQIRQAGEALWIHYPNGVAQSKLSPALFDRLAGSAVTARNWRTALALQKMISDPC